MHAEAGQARAEQDHDSDLDSLKTCGAHSGAAAAMTIAATTPRPAPTRIGWVAALDDLYVTAVRTSRVASCSSPYAPADQTEGTQNTPNTEKPAGSSHGGQ